MRLLFLTPSLPDPNAAHGGAVYLGNLVKALAEKAEVGVLSFRSTEQGDVPLDLPWQRTVLRRENRHMGRPELRRSQARLLGRWTFRRLPLLAAKHRVAEMRRALTEAIDQFRPDAIMVEFATMAQYLGDVADRIPTVFTDHEAGEPVSTFAPDSWADRRERRLWHLYVRSHYRHASRLQALTAEDAQRLTEVLDTPVGVRPPLVHLPEQTVAPATTKPVALFLGDYRHHPNPEAATVIARNVWPTVRAEAPDAELWLAGRTVGRELEGLDQLPGVKVLGFVDHLPSLLEQTRLLLAPVFSGGGSRIKVLTSLAHGLPVVTNSLGARGVPAPSPALQIVDDPGPLAERSLGLLTNAESAGEAGRLARTWAQENLSPATVAMRQLEQVEELVREWRSNR